MANKVIFTEAFRVSYPHLAAPYAQDPTKQTPKYGVTMMFPKTGVLPAHIGSSLGAACTPIMQALDEVCTQEWGVPFAQAPAVRQIQFPPAWKDGDQDWEKDERGNLLVGTPKQNSIGNWILSVKNEAPIGLTDPTNTLELQPAQVYAGCWARAQIEISAYVNKSGASIIALKCLNIQKCYDDENIGGGTVQQAATTAFSGMAVTDTNIANTGGAVPQAAAVPGQPATPQVATQQVAPQAAVPGQVQPNYLDPQQGQVAPQAAVPGQPAAPAQAGTPAMPAMPAQGQPVMPS